MDPAGLTHEPHMGRAGIAAELERARCRTLSLVDGLSEADQLAQHSALMSPFAWDLAHIGNYEEHWLLHEIDGRLPMYPALDDLYDAFAHPRSERPSLPILGPTEARAYDAKVRDEVLAVLANGGLDISPHSDRPLLRDGFAYLMVIQHEHQHDETLLAARQLMRERSSPPPGATPLLAKTNPFAGPAETFIDGGPFTMGATTDAWAYDNERQAHEITIESFSIDTVPVTNAHYLEFMADGGYDDDRVWSMDGLDWRNSARLAGPEFWRPDGEGAWSVLRFGTWLDLASIADEPVQHVCYHEADAFARWAGKRLPTEAEWEKAAIWNPTTATSHRYPWGDTPPVPRVANLDQRHCGPTAVGSHPFGASAYGVLGMIGDVWEWTSSPLQPYPGFEAFPYKEYSEVFWGTDYRVLRGGSWATDHTAVRGTFRNWDYPIRRQIFSGLRCARDGR